MAPNPEPKSEIAENEAELTKLVMEKDLASRAEVEACLKAQKEASAAGKPAALGDLLVRRGCLTPSQLARLRSSMEATRGQQIPGYQLLSKLGSGSTAAVFKARQISLNRIVALKVMPQRLSRDPDYVKRFYKEGEIAAKLNHPNIVQAIDIGEASGYHYFVMEYVEGKTVHDELAGGKVYTEAEALAIIIQIAKALEYAHAAGLIHRDVKPKNIMLMPDATAKLADMGLARAVDDAAAAQAEAGTLFGTPYYISPEQILARDIDARCDIYALGATLYHMVTGQVPFIGDDPKSVMVKHLKQPLVSPERLNLDLSAGLCKAINKMMAKDRAKRYANMTEALKDLESIEFLLDVEETPSGLAAMADEDELSASKSGPGGAQAAKNGAGASAEPAKSGTGKAPAGVKPTKPADKKTYAAPPAPRGFTMEPILPSVWKNPAVIGIIIALILSVIVNVLLLMK
ncbi:MAG: Serine/threonine-protein kinase PknB [Planctomycetes bacterium ADurb.Bin126]|nr:MAG: Serine/threonine-protein kinase PknB [Planctomycetes bacterium ADurb.Bin126]HOD80650.1 serine/threonine-protein kinase [Phycisphaerae bacterium]HQL73904.1 serine/threonine-protein kinase [Phycisphaerae bacterium]